MPYFQKCFQKRRGECEERISKYFLIYYHFNSKIQANKSQEMNTGYINFFFLINRNTNLLNKILVNKIQQHIKEINHQDHEGITPGIQ